MAYNIEWLETETKKKLRTFSDRKQQDFKKANFDEASFRRVSQQEAPKMLQTGKRCLV